LVEQVAGHSRYDKIDTSLPPSRLAGEYHVDEKRKRVLREALAAHGFHEAIGFSFIDAAHDNKFQLLPAFEDGTDQPDRFVTLQNPIVEDWNRMRPTLLPGLLSATRHNINQGERAVGLFDLGRICRG